MREYRGWLEKNGLLVTSKWIKQNKEHELSSKDKVSMPLSVLSHPRNSNE